MLLQLSKTEHTDITLFSKQVGLIQMHDVTNNSSRSLTQTFAAKKSIDSTYTFEFSKSLHAFFSVTVKADVTVTPFTAGFEIKGELTYSISENQQWTTTVSHTFSLNQVVTILPFRRVTIDGVIEMTENVERPFVAQILASMTVIRLSSFSRTVVRDPILHWELREYFEKYVQGKYIRDTGDGILFETKGTVRGSFGISTLLNVKEFPI